jgi:hypothetical protein
MTGAQKHNMGTRKIMNTDNLNKMADYFDGGPKGYFCMRQYCHCALGHSIRVLDEMKGNWNFQWVQGAAERLFGFRESDTKGQFLFSSQWIDNPKACAARFRYIALHGDAPSADQWDRFQFAPKVVEAEEEIEEAEAEELVCA